MERVLWTIWQRSFPTTVLRVPKLCVIDSECIYHCDPWTTCLPYDLFLELLMCNKMEFIRKMLSKLWEHKRAVVLCISGTLMNMFNTQDYFAVAPGEHKIYVFINIPKSRRLFAINSLLPNWFNYMVAGRPPIKLTLQ